MFHEFVFGVIAASSCRRQIFKNSPGAQSGWASQGGTEGVSQVLVRVLHQVQWDWHSKFCQSAKTYSHPCPCVRTLDFFLQPNCLFVPIWCPWEFWLFEEFCGWRRSEKPEEAGEGEGWRGVGGRRWHTLVCSQLEEPMAPISGVLWQWVKESWAAAGRCSTAGRSARQVGKRNEGYVRKAGGEAHSLLLLQRYM